MARFDGATWQPVGQGFNGTVRALLSEGGFLYAAGDFTASGSTTLNHFARWDGTDWNAIHAGTDGPAHALAAYHGEVHVGGSFMTVRNAAIATPAWARYLETGVVWIATQPQGATRPCGTNFAPDVQPAAGYSVQYQWRKDGVDLVDGPTGTGSTVVGANGNFALINVGLADQGTYDCVLFNVCGSETSLGATLTVTGCPLLGDMNCDRVFNTLDVSPFALALVNPTAYQQQFPNCNPLNGDMNVDTTLDGLDIGSFVTCLINGGCP